MNLQKLSDTNALNKKFYLELLHILGMKESRTSSKIVFEINKIQNSLISSISKRIEEKGKQIHKDTKIEIALELALTWINRIIFIKIFESQIIRFNDNANLSFFNLNKIKDFTDISNLFFQVLSIKPNKRDPKHKRFNYIPYLNCCIFNRTKLEKEILDISEMPNGKRSEIQIYEKTALKDTNGNKLTGKIPLLEYIIQFINSYEFSADSTQKGDTNKGDLLNASVLGKVFEKINGYKEGAYFTPGYITEHMCKEAIQSIIIERINLKNGWKCSTLTEINSHLIQKQKEDMINATDNVVGIIDSIRICDPAVGSGHFLVSAMNEIIRIKAELGLLTDDNGKPINCTISIENDELNIKVGGKCFEYKRKDADSKVIQQVLFREKKRIVENNLYGVDINPKSVEICKIRLQIELLQNIYYLDEPDKIDELDEFETLPNLNNNLKVGNSLIETLTLADSAVVDSGGLDGNENGNGNEDHQKFENELDWPTAFPKLIDTKGRFIGFDVIIGNPPYIYLRELDKRQKDYLKRKYSKKIDDLYMFFIYRAFDLLIPSGILCFITPNTYFSLSTQTEFRKKLLEYSGIKLQYVGYSFENANVETMILFVKNEKADSDSNIEMVFDNTVYVTESQVFRDNLFSRFFIPTDLNLHLNKEINIPLIPVAEKYADVLNAKQNINELNGYQNSLKAGDLTLLGLVSEGAQGLVTGNNSKFIAKIVENDNEAESIDNEFIKNYNIIRKTNLTLVEFRKNRNNYYNEAEKQKAMKGKRDLFGKRFIYKWVKRSDVKDFTMLSEDEKLNGGSETLWINYYRGNKTGEKWIVPLTDAVNWSRLSVNELKNRINTDSRWQGSKYYSRLGFGWVDYFTSNLKAFLVGMGPYSKDTVKLSVNHPLLSEKYILALLNSSFITYYIKNFITTTHTLQINDGRLIPIIIPEEDEKKRLEKLVNEIISAKDANNPTKVSEIETEIDRLVYEIYKINPDRSNFISLQP